MNCDNFNGLLDEYAGGELDAEARAMLRDHLDHCTNCRAALQRHTTVGDSIRHALDLASAGISLRPDIQRRILQAWESERLPDRRRAGLREWLVSACVRPAVPGAALVGVLALVLVIRFHHGQGPKIDTPSVNKGALNEYVIDVPIQMQTYVFQTGDDGIVDEIVTTKNGGRARLVAKSEHEL